MSEVAAQLSAEWIQQLNGILRQHRPLMSVEIYLTSFHRLYGIVSLKILLLLQVICHWAFSNVKWCHCYRCWALASFHHFTVSIFQTLSAGPVSYTGYSFRLKHLGAIRIPVRLPLVVCFREFNVVLVQSIIGALSGAEAVQIGSGGEGSDQINSLKN